MEFKDIQQIINCFQINSVSYSEIISELKEKRNKIHPDRNGGSFVSKIEETEFLNLNDAIEWINNNSQVLPLNQVTDLIRIIKDIGNEKNIKSEIDNQKNDLATALDSTKSLVTKQFQFPKIAVSVIAGAVSFLFLFPKQISEHPILSKLIDIRSSEFTNFWLFSLSGAIYLWIYSYIKDLKQQEITKTIESDLFQNDIFKSFVFNERKSEEDFILFSKSSLINFLLIALKPNKRKGSQLIFTVYSLGLYGIRPTIDTNIAENLASLIIKKNIDKGTISKDESISLDDLYRTNAKY